jgi:hypothetical protein
MLALAIGLGVPLGEDLLRRCPELLGDDPAICSGSNAGAASRS